jgi:hypothetical protein
MLCEGEQVSFNCFMDETGGQLKVIGQHILNYVYICPTIPTGSVSSKDDVFSGD